MNVREIMISNISTADRQMRVDRVVRLMLDQGIAGVPVVENGKLLGMITETDLVTKHAHVHMPTYLGILGTVIPFERRGTDEEIRRVLAVTAGDLMEEAAVIAPDTSVEDVATLMVDEGVNPVAVVDRGRFLGLVSHRELVRLLLLQDEGSEPPTNA
jgi:CBS domain-containing protein